MIEFKGRIKISLWSLLAVVFLLGPASSHAKNLIVSELQGKDTNPGTAERPLKTINAALLKAQPGDRIKIHTGTYRETLLFPRSGSNSSHTIALEALPGANVRIKGSDLVTGWVWHSQAIWKRTNWDVNCQQMFVDGVPLHQIGMNSPFHTRTVNGKVLLPPTGNGLRDMIPGSFWFDRSLKTLYIRLKDSTPPDRHEVEASVRNWVIPFYERLSFIELRGLHFSHSNQTAGGFTNGIVNISGRSWVIAGNTFTYGDFAGLHVSGEGHVIRGNVLNHNGNSGIYVNGSDTAHQWKHYSNRTPQNIVIEGNETSFNNYRHFHIHWHAGGIKIIPSCNGVQILLHRAIANYGHGIWVDGWCQNIRVNRCLAQRNAGAGIFYEISDMGIISNNLVLKKNNTFEITGTYL